MTAGGLDMTPAEREAMADEVASVVAKHVVRVAIRRWVAAVLEQQADRYRGFQPARGSVSGKGARRSKRWRRW